MKKFISVFLFCVIVLVSYLLIGLYTKSTETKQTLTGDRQSDPSYPLDKTISKELTTEEICANFSKENSERNYLSIPPPCYDYFGITEEMVRSSPGWDSGFQR